MKRTKPDFSDVLEEAAHIIADGVCLRAGNPFLHDPDAENVIIVDAYPEPATPTVTRSCAFLRLMRRLLKRWKPLSTSATPLSAWNGTTNDEEVMHG